MTVSLAEKLGHKGLTAVSLHPGAILTNLSNHIDWQTEYADLGKYIRRLQIHSSTDSTLARVDRMMGNFEGWKEAFDLKSPERGVATHVYAAFEPDLKGKLPFG